MASPSTLTDADIDKLGKPLTDADIAAAESQPEPRGFWESFIGKPEDFTNTVRGLGHAIVHPLDTLRDMGNQTIDLFKGAGQEFGRGNITGGVRKGTNAIINTALPGVGAASEHAGQTFDTGNVAGGLGETAALGANTALALTSPRVPRAVAEMKPIIRPAIAGVKAAAPGVGKGAAMIGTGEALAHVPGMEWPARIGLGYPGARMIGRGLGEGFEAFKAARNPAPGQALASEAGQDWNALKPADRQMLNDIARARNNAADQPRSPAPVIPISRTAPAAGPTPDMAPPIIRPPNVAPETPGTPPMTRAADFAPRPAPEPIMPEPTAQRAAPLPIKAPAKPGPAARMGARGTGGDFLASPRIAPPAPAAPRMALSPIHATQNGASDTAISPEEVSSNPNDAPELFPPRTPRMASFEPIHGAGTHSDTPAPSPSGHSATQIFPPSGTSASESSRNPGSLVKDAAPESGNRAAAPSSGSVSHEVPQKQIITPPTPEQMAAPFQSDEAKVNAFNARKDRIGAARHMENRKNAAQVIADYAKSKGYDDPEVMQAATNEHWKAVAKAAGKPDVSDQTIAAAKAILTKK